MAKVFVYLLILGIVLFVLWRWGQYGSSTASPTKWGKSRDRFRGKRDPREIWMQVYETASVEEARMVQARFQEVELECVLYEQGKKDIHGNAPKGIGVAVPKSSAPQAQNIISRLPV